MADEAHQQRYDEARDAIVAVVEAFPDVFSPDLEMPMLADWILLTTHDDAADFVKCRSHAIYPKGQWYHRSIGLCALASDEFLGGRHHAAGDE